VVEVSPWVGEVPTSAANLPKKTFPQWWLWQYTEHGKCDGIPGDSEGNLDLNKYVGTEKQLIVEWREEVPPKPAPRPKKRGPRTKGKRSRARTRGALRKRAKRN